MLRKIIFISVICFSIAHPLKAQKEFKANTHMTLEPTASEVCALSVARMEEKYDIKPHVLETIASVESGVFDHQTGKFVSWPWSINVHGKGYRFASKEEAVAKVKELQAQGIQSIDVGCMQISLKFHGSSFESVEDAFNPDNNVEYSAQFLTKLYQKKGDWQKAAMAYHSKVPTHAQAYQNRLLARFNKMKFAFLDYHPDISLF
ncbi:MAG: transglycosylase SLT domain-containing protein [Alphaproteobacteria bacterium]|nr:transglycosylase SLT domain-containing protein [Alphaproteobacteria bacterium]